MEDKVRSVFCGPMSGRKKFLFQYLQPTGGGVVREHWEFRPYPPLSPGMPSQLPDWAIVSSRYTSWPLMN